MKTCYKTTVIKHTNQHKRTENKHWTTDFQEGQETKWKNSLFKKWCWDIGYPHKKE